MRRHPAGTTGAGSQAHSKTRTLAFPQRKEKTCRSSMVIDGPLMPCREGAKCPDWLRPRFVSAGTQDTTTLGAHTCPLTTLNLLLDRQGTTIPHFSYSMPGHCSKGIACGADIFLSLPLGANSSITTWCTSCSSNSASGMRMDRTDALSIVDLMCWPTRGMGWRLGRMHRPVWDDACLRRTCGRPSGAPTHDRKKLSLLNSAHQFGTALDTWEGWGTSQAAP